MKNNTNIARLPKAALAAAALLAAFTGSANAQVYWDNGGTGDDIDVAENWTSDTLPTGGTLGIIDNSNQDPAVVEIFNISGYTIRQDAGQVRYVSGRTLTDTVWEMKGGTMDGGNNNRLTINDTSLIIDGGTWTGGADIYNSSGGGASVSIKSGSLTLDPANNADNNGIWNVGADRALTISLSGGALTADAIRIRNNSSTFTVTGGTASLTGTKTAIELGAIMTFGLGNGTVSIASAPTISGASYIDFLTGTGGALTITGYTSTDYSTLWDSGFLRIDGVAGSSGGFNSSDFEVNGATLTLIPEPGTLTLVGVMGLALYAGLRRRK